MLDLQQIFQLNAEWHLLRNQRELWVTQLWSRCPDQESLMVTEQENKWDLRNHSLWVTGHFHNQFEKVLRGLWVTAHFHKQSEKVLRGLWVAEQ